MDYLPPFKILFDNMRILSREYRKETNSLLLRILAMVGIMMGSLIALALLAAMVLPRGSVALIPVFGVIIFVTVPGMLYYVILSFAKAQEIGLAAVEHREPDFGRIRIWQSLLYFLILAVPIIIISLVLMALHLTDLTLIFSLADVTIFYLVPMAVAANGSAVDGIEQAFKLFRANPAYVCLCGAVPAVILYAVSILPMEFGIYLRQQSPSASAVATLITLIGSTASTVLLIRYEPFYRAQIYQSMVEPSMESEEELMTIEGAAD